MPNWNLYRRIANYEEMGGHLPDISSDVTDNLNPAFVLRPYQEKALRYFLYSLKDYPKRVKPTQLLFHMATGSGKTLIMAAAMLYLYQQDYRDFIFFVNSTNIVEKTRDNFGRDLGTRLLDSGLPVSVSVIGRSPVVSQRPPVHQATARAAAS